MIATTGMRTSRSDARRAALIACLAVCLSASAASADPAATGNASTNLGSEEQDLAKQLANPVASLISVPFQINFDRGLNVQDSGWRTNVNIQPVIPLSLTPDWNLISRTIVPVVYSEDALVGSGRIFGSGDTVQSLFLSPARPWNGIIWGAGPVVLAPTGSSDVYSVHQWGAGPTGVVLDQSGPWTVGALANHVWSFARTGYPAPQVNATFLQPFISYTTPDAWTYSLNTESTYDWTAHKWQVPINAVVSKVLKVGPQLISVAAGVRYYAASPDPLAKGFGARLAITFLFPK